MSPTAAELALRVVATTRARGWRIATAESCTGGLLSAAITDVPGSSSVFDRGFVTYSNASKMALLGVGEATLAAHGAVSRETAREMALGAIERSLADIAASITGIAGPDGGSTEKPVGLVYFCCATRGGGSRVLERRFGPLGRAEIRARSTEQALELLLEAAYRRP